MDEERAEKRKKFEAPKPVSVGDSVDVTIESVGGQGDGIAKVGGFVIFVKGAAKGESCKVKIVDVKRTYAVGEKLGAASPPGLEGGEPPAKGAQSPPAGPPGPGEEEPEEGDEPTDEGEEEAEEEGEEEN